MFDLVHQIGELPLKNKPKREHFGLRYRKRKEKLVSKICCPKRWNQFSQI
jgi:hypothetical protein